MNSQPASTEVHSSSNLVKSVKVVFFSSSRLGSGPVMLTLLKSLYLMSNLKYVLEELITFILTGWGFCQRLIAFCIFLSKPYIAGKQYFLWFRETQCSKVKKPPVCLDSSAVYFPSFLGWTAFMCINILVALCHNDLPSGTWEKCAEIPQLSLAAPASEVSPLNCYVVPTVALDLILMSVMWLFSYASWLA